jgi:hypothetical protein
MTLTVFHWHLVTLEIMFTPGNTPDHPVARVVFIQLI